MMLRLLDIPGHIACLLLAVWSIVVTGCGPGETRSSSSSDGFESEYEMFLGRLVAIQSVVGGDGRSLYGRPEAPEWAPDGSRLVFTGLGQLWEVSANGGDLVPGPRGSRPAYSPDGRWLAFTGRGEIHLLDRANGEVRPLIGHGAGVHALSWSPNSGTIAFISDRFGTRDLFTVTVPDGAVRQLTSHALFDGFPVWSPGGDTIFFQRMDEWWVDHEVLAISRSGGVPRQVVRDEDFFDYTYGSRFGQPQVSPDGRFLLFSSQRSGWINQWVVPLEGGDPFPLAAEEADQEDARWSPRGDRVAFLSNSNGTIRIRIATPSTGGISTVVDPGIGYIHGPRWSPDAGKLSFVMGTPTRPQDLYVVDVASGEIRQLTQSLSDPSFEHELVVPRKIEYLSGDGTIIYAYLYVPDELAAGEPAPALIRLHGGPTAQYYDHFERNIQYYVRRGFVVLLPNIRGSSGYGSAFEHANNGCWGHCDLEDVVAGAEYLRSLTFVDSKRIGVFGRSYGGFLTLAAVVFAPEQFQAAISRAGYSDRIKYLDETSMAGVRLLRYELGSVEEHMDRYRAASPVLQVHNAMTPTMVIEGAVRPALYGEGLEPANSTNLQFVRAMQRHGKIVEYVSYLRPQDGTVEWPGDKPRMLREKADFFDRYLRSTTNGVR